MPDAESERKKAVRYALLLLGYRGRSEKEFRRRLKLKGFGPETVDETVSYLLERGYVDDTALADALKWEASSSKLLGKFGAKAFLIERGIPPKAADGVLGDYDELEPAWKLAEKKLRTMEGLKYDKIKHRLTGLMRRRGYSFDTIKLTLKGIRKEDRE